MELGNIVEFIDHQRILCAVVLEVKNQRLRLLTELDREVNLAVNRLAHRCDQRLDPAMSRIKMVQMLKETALRRNSLVERVNVRELWEVLNTEQEWIDLPTMTALCFSNTPSGDQESAVMRAFFQNRTYFKFKEDGFFPLHRRACPGNEGQGRGRGEKKQHHSKRRGLVQERHRGQTPNDPRPGA